MRIEDDELLARFRGWRCEYCGGTLSPCCGHHIFSRGAGRIDAPWALVSLCAFCHAGNHYSGRPGRDELLAIAARREGATPEWVEQEVYRLRRLDKDADPGPGYWLSPTGWRCVDRRPVAGRDHQPLPTDETGPAPGHRLPGVEADEAGWHQL